MKTKIILFIGIFLTACTNFIGNDIPPVPHDWEYLDCPDTKYFECNLSFPLPKDRYFEFQGYRDEELGYMENEVVTSVGSYLMGEKSFPVYFIVQNLGKYRYSFEEIAQCKNFQLPEGKECTIAVRYIKSFPGYEIMSYQTSTPNTYIFRVKIGDKMFFIRGYADEETVHLLDTAILNVRLVEETYEWRKVSE